jgi:hypothetical protein
MVNKQEIIHYKNLTRRLENLAFKIMKFFTKCAKFFKQTANAVTFFQKKVRQRSFAY